MLRRSGVTLVELLVALALGGMVLGVAASSMLRQQRSARWIEGLSGAELQLRAALRLITDELEPLDPSAGDLAAGQASDSTLQLRAVVAASLTCDSSALVTLVPDTGSSPPLGGVARAPAIGDSLWLDRGDSLGWEGHAVIGVARVAVPCAVPTAARAPAWRITLNAPAGVPSATPVRITRWERWVVYRASDGRWYLGLRDWNPTAGRFLAAQPIAGPFVRAAGGAITGFRYFDDAGAELTPDGTNERAIARVRISTLSAVPALGADSVRRDSADAVLSRRGAS